MKGFLRLSSLAATLALLPACGTAEEERRPFGVVQHDDEVAVAEPVPTPTPEPLDPHVEETRAQLTALLTDLGRDFGGSVGIAVVDVEEDWTTGFGEENLLPQQSVSKLWVTLTALDQIDKGELAPDRKIIIGRDDLTVFHQPIRSTVLARGSVETDPIELIERAITESDNTANDALLNAVGGPEAVRTMLREKGLAHIRFGPGEREMQSRIAGLEWQQRYALTRQGFFDARDEVPDARRKSAFERYLADPIDGATPRAVATALARLVRGDLLSEQSTEQLVDIMRQTKSGPRRLKGAVREGWSIAHKTGTGQFYDGRQSGYNDVGLLFSPDGRAYALAVMIGETRRPTPERMDMMQSVVRAVIDYHEALSEQEQV